MVHGDGEVSGQQGQDGLVEDQDAEEDQHPCTQGPESPTGGCSAACWEFLPDRMKQKEAGLRKKATPLFSAMAMQMEPMAIMVRLRSASMAAAKFRAAGETFIGQGHKFSSTLFTRRRLLHPRLSLRKPEANTSC